MKKGIMLERQLGGGGRGKGWGKRREEGEGETKPKPPSLPRSAALEKEGGEGLPASCSLFKSVCVSLRQSLSLSSHLSFSPSLRC